MASSEMTLAELRAQNVVKPNKHGAVKTFADGMMFDSKLEATHWGNLRLAERAGRISGLRRQVTFELQPGFAGNDGRRVRSIEMCWDFTYVEDGRSVVNDTKGIQTRESRIKVKMFRFKFPQYVVRITKAEGGKRR